MQIDVDASQARGAGVNPEDPPLRWEVSQGDGQWAPASVLEDLTGGFNYGSGTVELELPPRSAIEPRSPASACTGCAAGSPRRRAPAAQRRRPTRTRRRSTRSPPRRSARACPSTHAVADRARDPRRLRRHARPDLPAAPPARCSSSAPGETLEVQDPDTGDWARWEWRDDFVGSTELDRHFTRRPRLAARSSSARRSARRAARWIQYGAVPPKGAVLRFTRYRHGGGRDGNVTADTLTVLKSTIAGVDTVTNPDAAQRRRRRRDHHPRAPARVDGDPLALPRGHRRGLRVPGRRGEPARRPRGLHPAARRRRGAAAPASRASTRPTGACTSRS